MTEHEDIVLRFSATLRATELYAASHPLVQRSAAFFVSACQTALGHAPMIIVAFLDGEIVVNDVRLSKANATLTGLVRAMRDREIEKITFSRDIDTDDIHALMEELRRPGADRPVGERLAGRGINRITIGRLALADSQPPAGPQESGLTAARQIYARALTGAEQIWKATKSGEDPDPAGARSIIDSLSKLVDEDRTSLMALTTLKRHDDYTFTHMVNVTALSMALARSLKIEGTLLNEFGFAALMHDIGKVNTPVEVLNKPDKLTKDEFEIMKRHVVDGAHILRRMPDVPALAPVVAFEHHLRYDLTGYPENLGSRTLNLCTMVVTVADVFDALRSNRVYREGLATDRIKAIMQQQSGAFNKTLLRRFVNMMGLYPVGAVVRLNSAELGVVTREHPDDPLRPQVKLIRDAAGNPLEQPVLCNTWQRDDRGEFPYVILEAVDAQDEHVDPLSLLENAAN
jgi:putative nucleotidyltransferase with HDIG domain